MISLMFFPEFVIGERVQLKGQPEYKYIVESYEVYHITDNRVTYYEIVVNDGTEKRAMNPLSLEPVTETNGIE